MASFIAKQMVGNQLKSVKGAIGGGDDSEKKEGGGEGGEEGEEGEDPEITAARKEAEDKRAEKHQKMEEERETMRQGIRDKYGIKKKEIPVEMPIEDMGPAGIGRRRKTPAEMEAEKNAEDNDEDSEMFPTNLDDFKNKVTGLPGTVMTSVTEATEKCVLQ